MRKDPQDINLSLISHTNVGKTTLTRTLLGEDVGEITDLEHVTKEAEGYTLAREGGSRLLLWDTPGFGNSKSLTKVLEDKPDPVEWFINKPLEREKSEALWLNQRVFCHIKEHTDVILYLVNASESPNTAYIRAEMKMLPWFGKPIIVLLNQIGEKRSREETRRISEWEDLRRYNDVREVLPFDAFFRCWVQEYKLWDTIEKVIDEEKKSRFAYLKKEILEERKSIYETSIKAMARTLSNIISQEEELDIENLIDRIKTAVKRAILGKGYTVGRDFLDSRRRKQRIKSIRNSLLSRREKTEPNKDLKGSIQQFVAEIIYGDTKAAQDALADHAAEELDELTHQLVAFNKLERKEEVPTRILENLADDIDVCTRADPAGSSFIGALLGGFVTGFMADIMAGGLTLGSGAIIGAIVGALGGAGLANVYNIGNNSKENSISWGQKAIKGFTTEVVLLYLSVAHFGRGRGKWEESDPPSYWREPLEIIVDDLKINFEELIRIRKTKTREEELATCLKEILKETFLELHDVNVDQQ